MIKIDKEQKEKEKLAAMPVPPPEAPLSVNAAVASVSKGDKVEFTVVFQCKICNPVEGMWLNHCKVKSITKAGIHAEVVTENDIVPVTVFIAKDHYVTNAYFNSVKENDDIRVKVIGSRFELNDPYICVIGQLLDPSYQDKRQRIRGGSAEMQKIVLGGDVEMDDISSY
jgi:hypothetical protein